MAGPGSVVEGTNPHLLVEITGPDGGTGAVGALRPVLLLHGFASSSELNWQTSGWIPALTAAGRRVITVDLPGHGGSAAPDDLDSYRPSRIRADLLQVLQDAGVSPLTDNDPASGLDIIGYSLGSRLAWEFGATQPELVHRMVLGGPGSGDPLADFDLDAAREAAAGGAPVADPGTAELLRMAQLVPQNRLTALFRMIEAIKEEPFSPAAAVPAMPLLLVAGDRDALAVTAPELAALSGSAELVQLPARTHTNAVTSRAFKNAALEFLNG
ncbi:MULTISPECIES: alpha/beta hydrolase [unclassified Arthrobacter]|uniref:alpha/beta fold hydrolase n=1 Tax=unclassified Arthrobacter TaxID=235627 RepID=UPI0024DF473C|nr:MULTISPECIES: alpha/beta hydrolase [unclassified Arthrobacter]MCC9146593.1 alpha/beta hydrolase [Arthrobacter sp. zg-Y919]MDK1277823.1 alpha/beta hydrolase [Arthrobacter sp. zg.Y919]WIB02223.1 alpha/beta hydrolase [Arthrobacter sp. zg-Y919]